MSGRNDLDKIKEKKETRERIGMLQHSIEVLRDKLGKVMVDFKETNESNKKIEMWVENSKSKYIDLCSALWLECFKVESGHIENTQIKYDESIKVFMKLREDCYNGCPIGTMPEFEESRKREDDLRVEADSIQIEIHKLENELLELNKSVMN